MKCPRCGASMREEKRSFHKQRKWICPQCNKVRMQQQKREKAVKNRREN